MEAIYFGSAGRRATGPFKADGPWIGADLENGLCVAAPFAAPLRGPQRPRCPLVWRRYRSAHLSAPGLSNRCGRSVLRLFGLMKEPGLNRCNRCNRCVVQSWLFGPIKRAGTSLWTCLYTQNIRSLEAGPFSVARLKMDLPFQNRLVHSRVRRTTVSPLA
jgi:hypothetical protein